MNPELRFHSIIISITTAIVFIVWLGLNKAITTYPVLAVILSGLISLGIYKTLALLFLTLFRNNKLVKKFILGPRYMEGIWAGFFVGHENRIRFFFEIFEQDLSRTIIRGRVFREDGNFHGSWIADDATIDPLRAKLTYHYQADAIGNTFINPGIACFVFERPASYKAPNLLIGFSSDLFNPHKYMAFEEKVSDNTILESFEALNKAQEIYEKYKVHVQPVSRPIASTDSNEHVAQAKVNIGITNV